METAPSPEVTRNDESSRYEIHVDGVLAGFTEFFYDAQGRAVFPHTSVDSAYAGQGLGAILVSAAMTDTAARGETVVPRCTFVARCLNKREVPGLDIHWPTPRGQ